MSEENEKDPIGKALNLQPINSIKTGIEAAIQADSDDVIHARRNILKGHKLTEADLIIKGPYGGIAPDFYGNVIGRSVKKNINEDYPITWEDL